MNVCVCVCDVCDVCVCECDCLAVCVRVCIALSYVLQLKGTSVHISIKFLAACHKKFKKKKAKNKEEKEATTQTSQKDVANFTIVFAHCDF